MDLNNIFLTIAAIVPAAILCIYIYKKDRAEKEPAGLLLLLLGLGVLICYPAAVTEQLLSNILDSIFIPFCTQMSDGTFVIEDPILFRIYTALEYFLNVALVEEGYKLLVLVLATRKNKNFNSLFDGIIYSVFVSLGFAGFENILYVTNYGWANALVRAVMSVPAHMFFSIFMGYYYSMWHMKIKANKLEINLKQYGIIAPDAPEFSWKKDIALCLVVPVLAHGLYDYSCSVGSFYAEILFYGFLIFMYFFCFNRIKKMSSMDMDDNRFASAMVSMKHPEYLRLLREKQEQQLDESIKQQAYTYSHQTQYAEDPRYSTPAPEQTDHLYSPED